MDITESTCDLHVEHHSASNMLWIANWAACAQFSTMKCETQLRNACAKLAIVQLRWSLNYNHSVENRLTTSLRTKRAKHEVISSAVGFWSNMRQAFFDVKVVSPYAKSNMNETPNGSRSVNKRRSENTENVFLTWNMETSLHLCLPVLERWLLKVTSQ